MEMCRASLLASLGPHFRGSQAIDVDSVAKCQCLGRLQSSLRGSISWCSLSGVSCVHHQPSRTDNVVLDLEHLLPGSLLGTPINEPGQYRFRNVSGTPTH